ncbi:site-specific DNA-methyltransferase [Bacillus thuringiensis]|uniref:site-specific DNA-methyltransferase n=1 Tax=Bacillus thuringiensis TaxID=1428 RepID=UPI000BED2862|nr:DNA methyltransferase [Bacillus thuringiensis]PEF07908.1 site-specific DNA-methyltransferase [Bacillus thuringiensis]
MVNLSKVKRDEYIEKINVVKMNLLNSSVQDSDTIRSLLSELESKIKAEKYGINYESHEEEIDTILKNHTPVFREDKSRHIDNGENKNFLIEGDNLAAIKGLRRTHNKKVDLIYIDPPYNRGENDFIYDDKYVDSEDAYRHSKWLSFMEKRIIESRKLLNNQGVILIHIDENEVFNLVALMNKIYGEKNDLGMVIWNKRNPKGDAKGVSAMHEYVLCYAKNKELFLKLENTCKRKKPNAIKMLNKANSLYKKIGKKEIPEEVRAVIKPFNYPKSLLENFKVEYTLDLVNKEFRNWLSRQNFSGGEKAYKNIDEYGEVYRGVSMAWPNKKTAPDNYFIPLVHPVTKKACPVPQRGWRNPPATMEKLLKSNRVLFGEDETKQPERKYLLRENMLENTPSIYDSAASDDNYFLENNINFEYAKPIEALKYFITSIHPSAKVILDFFAGSGSTGHAVMELNKEEKLQRSFILVTNNQNNICEEITYRRLKLAIEQEDYQESLKYYKTEFIDTVNNFYLDYTNQLMESIEEIIELDLSIQADNKDKYLIAREENDLTNIDINGKMNLINKLYIGQDVFLDTLQENKFKNANIDIISVPEYYYGDLKE